MGTTEGSLWVCFCFLSLCNSLPRINLSRGSLCIARSAPCLASSTLFWQCVPFLCITRYGLLAQTTLSSLCILNCAIVTIPAFRSQTLYFGLQLTLHVSSGSTCNLLHQILIAHMSRCNINDLTPSVLFWFRRS